MSRITRAWPNFGAYFFFSTSTTKIFISEVFYLPWTGPGLEVLFSHGGTKNILLLPNLRLGFDFSLGIPVI